MLPAGRLDHREDDGPEREQRGYGADYNIIESCLSPRQQARKNYRRHGKNADRQQRKKDQTPTVSAHDGIVGLRRD